MFRIGQLLEIYDEDDCVMGLRIVPIKNTYITRKAATIVAYKLADEDYIEKLKSFILEANLRIELAEMGRHKSYTSDDENPFAWSEVWDFDRYIERVAHIGDYIVYEDVDSHPWFDLTGVPEGYLIREVNNMEEDEDE